MMTKLKEASVLFFIQVLSYTIWCINFRAVADAQYHTAAASDFMIASIQFFVIRRIAHGQDHLHQWAGLRYLIGKMNRVIRWQRVVTLCLLWQRNELHDFSHLRHQT